MDLDEQLLSLKTITPACSGIAKEPECKFGEEMGAVGIMCKGCKHKSRVALSVIRPQSLARLAASRAKRPQTRKRCRNDKSLT